MLLKIWILSGVLAYVIRVVQRWNEILALMDDPNPKLGKPWTRWMGLAGMAGFAGFMGPFALWPVLKGLYKHFSV